MTATDSGDVEFLEGYAWPVRREHRDFLEHNCFDTGSTFHSDPAAYGAGWQRPRYSLQVEGPTGVLSAKAAEANLELTLRCRWHDWGRGEVRQLSALAGAVMALLRTGEVEPFLSSATDLWRALEGEAG